MYEIQERLIAQKEEQGGRRTSGTMYLPIVQEQKC